MPNIMGDVRMEATEFEMPNDDVGGLTCCWWIWFRVWSNITNVIGKRAGIGTMGIVDNDGNGLVMTDGG